MGEEGVETGERRRERGERERGSQAQESKPP